MFEKTKINEKEVGPFFKKLAESCCLVKYLLLLLNDLVALNARQAEMNPLAAVLGHGDKQLDLTRPFVQSSSTQPLALLKVSLRKNPAKKFPTGSVLETASVES